MNTPRALLGVVLTGVMLAGGVACSTPPPDVDDPLCASPEGAPCDTPDAACDTFKEPMPLAPATFHVTNRRVVSISLDQCGPGFSVAVDGEMLWGELPYWLMNYTCENELTADPGVSGCEGSTIDIAPGASIDVSWSGKGFRATIMPDACYPESTKTNREQLGQSPDAPCYQSHAVAPGTIEVAFHFLTTDRSPFDVTQTLQLASGATLNVDVN